MPERNVEDVLKDYRVCFSTDAGRRVLKDILKSGFYFDDDIQGERMIAVKNFVARILHNCVGIWSGCTEEQVDRYINAVLNLPLELHNCHLREM
jgi:hypothetical protein